MAIEVFAAVMLMEVKLAALTFSATLFDVTPLCVALMFADPAATPVATTAMLTVATAVFDDAHATEVVRFCVEPSLKLPVAVN